MSCGALGSSIPSTVLGRSHTVASRRAQVVRCQAAFPKLSQNLLRKTGSIVVGIAATLSVIAVPTPELLLDATPLSTEDLIEKLNTNILPKIRQQITDLSRSSDNNTATEELKKQLQTVESSIGKLLDDVQAGKQDLVPGDAGELQTGFDNIKKSLPNFS